MHLPTVLHTVVVLSTLVRSASGAVLNVVDFGAKPDVSTTADGKQNTAAINKALANANPGDTVLVPEATFWALGGIAADGLEKVTLQVDGVLNAVPDTDAWPLDGNKYAHFIHLTNAADLTVTGKGTLNGEGVTWWNLEILTLLKHKRPKLLVIEQATDLLIENIYMQNSPSFHLLISDIARAEVRNITIYTNRDKIRKIKARKAAFRAALGVVDFEDNPLQPEDLNTDGIDPSGRDIWIHDCSILNDDDSIAVKPCNANCVNADCSENMLIENMIMTGFGASIGSVPPKDPPNCVRNITFRNISMPETGKGVYVKSNPTCEGNKSAIIQDILYQDISITNASWWAIWIGPQQQQEPGSDLGRKCSLTFPLDPRCPTQGCVDFRNIVLRNVLIEYPTLSPGVILGNSSNFMDVTLDNVVAKHMGTFPYGKNYLCNNTNVTCINCKPEPICHKWPELGV